MKRSSWCHFQEHHADNKSSIWLMRESTRQEIKARNQEKIPKCISKFKSQQFTSFRNWRNLQMEKKWRKTHV